MDQNKSLPSCTTAATTPNMKRLQVAIVPSPGLGHLIPLAEFARRIVQRHPEISIRFLIPTIGPPTQPQISALQLLPSESISHLFLPPVNFSKLPLNPAQTRIETLIIRSLTESEPALRDSLHVMAHSTGKLVAVVFDVFGPPIFGLAGEFGALPYVFSTSSAMDLCAMFQLPELDRSFTGEYKDLPNPVQFFPGCVPVHGADFMEPLLDRKNELYGEFLQIAKGYSEAAGFILNSFPDLEPAACTYLLENGHKFPPVYPVGPLIANDSPFSIPSSGSVNGSECLIWLDRQPAGSVLFVSFGSGGTLSRDQLTELAFGLELSGQRFLWVLKSPHDKASNASFFTAQSIEKDPVEFLPHGFLDRTHGVGTVVPSWAPQVRILAHGSVGGFLTHCGWNSTLESVVNGVPLIAWPLFAEQRLNAVSLSEDLKVAIRVEPNDEGMVERGRISDYVKDLIAGEVGKSIRGRMLGLKENARRALEEDGSSAKYLEDVVEAWKGNGTM